VGKISVHGGKLIDNATTGHQRDQGQPVASKGNTSASYLSQHGRERARYHRERSCVEGQRAKKFAATRRESNSSHESKEIERRRSWART